MVAGGVHMFGVAGAHRQYEVLSGDNGCKEEHA